MKTVRVFIFDDNAARRDSLELLLDTSDGFELVGSSPDCSQATEDIKQANPDVILMDIEMPGVSGIDATRTLKATYSEIPILIQTVFDDDKKVFDAIKAGASGYILKSTSAEMILQSINDVMEGGAPMTPSIANKVLDFFRNVSTPADTDKADEYNLSSRELEVLSLLVKGKSYKMIAADLSITYHTVNSHIKKIYEKLHVHSVAEAVNKALRDRIVR